MQRLADLLSQQLCNTCCYRTCSRCCCINSCPWASSCPTRSPPHPNMPPTLISICTYINYSFDKYLSMRSTLFAVVTFFIPGKVPYFRRFSVGAPLQLSLVMILSLPGLIFSNQLFLHQACSSRTERSMPGIAYRHEGTCIRLIPPFCKEHACR